jgi:hypothetical protein
MIIAKMIDMIKTIEGKLNPGVLKEVLRIYKIPLQFSYIDRKNLIQGCEDFIKDNGMDSNITLVLWNDSYVAKDYADPAITVDSLNGANITEDELKKMAAIFGPADNVPCMFLENTTFDDFSKALNQVIGMKVFL